MSYRGGPPVGGLEAEAVSCGVDQPGVVVRALHAGVEAQGLAGQLAAGEGKSSMNMGKMFGPPATVRRVGGICVGPSSRHHLTRP